MITKKIRVYGIVQGVGLQTDCRAVMQRLPESTPD